MEAHRDYYADFLFDSEAAARAATAALAATDATENGSAANGGGAPPSAETNGAAMNGATGASASENGADGGGAGSNGNGKDEEDGVFSFCGLELGFRLLACCPACLRTCYAPHVGYQRVAALACRF